MMEARNVIQALKQVPEVRLRLSLDGWEASAIDVHRRTSIETAGFRFQRGATGAGDRSVNEFCESKSN